MKEISHENRLITYNPLHLVVSVHWKTFIRASGLYGAPQPTKHSKTLFETFCQDCWFNTVNTIEYKNTSLLVLLKLIKRRIIIVSFYQLLSYVSRRTLLALA